MSDIEYSVKLSDVIKSFDCIWNKCASASESYTDEPVV